EFREENEFANLDGRSKGRSVTVATSTAVSVPMARAVGDGQSHARVVGDGQGQGGWEAFGELELDRYEGVHILSRRLTEIASDVTELTGQLSKGLMFFSDDS